MLDDRPTTHKTHRARAEVTLARPDDWVLADGQLRPDALTPFYAAMQQFDSTVGEKPTVVFDLVPLTKGEVISRRKKLAQQFGRGGEPVGRSWFGTSNAQPFDLFATLETLIDPMSAASKGSTGRNYRRPPRAEGTEGMHDLYMERTKAEGLRDVWPHFHLQVRVTADSPSRARSKQLLHLLLQCFEQWSGENYWKPKGIRLAGFYLAADAPWARPLFDFGMRWGPRGNHRRLPIVSATKLVGVLVPATKNCPIASVARTGGVVAAAPKQLPRWRPGDHHLIPWGVVSSGGTESIVGVRKDETYFTATFGRSGFGKSETALVRMAALASAIGTDHGEGFLFVDPHSDGIARLKQWLPPSAHGRVIELSLADARTRSSQTCWNPFSMEAMSADDMEAKASAIVDSFAKTMDWEKGYPQTNTILLQTTYAILELAAHLPADLAPTIFQMKTLLINEQWRHAVLPHLSRQSQTFFAPGSTFETFSDGASSPVTNFLDRLQRMESVASALGASQSTYEIDRAMNEGNIVLVNLGDIGQSSSLVASMLIFDVLRTAKNRRHLPVEHRRPFHLFLDEAQMYDKALHGLLAATLEQARKYNLRLHLFNQDPQRLSPSTLKAVGTNRSHLMTTSLEAGSASAVEKQWAGAVTAENILKLGRYQFLTDVTFGSSVSAPFRAGGLSLDRDIGPENQAPLTERLEASIMEASGNRDVDDILREMNSLDHRIHEHLTRPSNVAPIGSAPSSSVTYFDSVLSGEETDQ